MDLTQRIDSIYIQSQMSSIFAKKDEIHTNTILDGISIKKGTVSVLAGLPGENKSRIMIAYSLLLARAGYKILYLTTDSTSKILTQRFLASASMVKEDSITTGALSRYECDCLLSSANANAYLGNISVNDNILYIANYDKILQDHNYDVAIIDSINNFTLGSGLGVRNDNSYLVTRLEKIADERNVSIIFTHHLPQKIAHRNSGSRPMCDDSHWIKYPAVRSLAYLYKPARYCSKPEEKGIYYLYFDKYPEFAGRVGFKLYYDEERNSFFKIERI